MDFILDIKEKDTTEPKAPSFPQIKPTASGFPEPKKRTRVSAFKQKRQGIKPEEAKAKVFTASSKAPLSAPNNDVPTGPANDDFQSSEQRRIDRENSERLASMSPQEIESARQELFSGLDPSLLNMLLKRANLDDANGPSPFDGPTSTTTQDSAVSQHVAQEVPTIRVDDTSLHQSHTSPSDNQAPPKDRGDPSTAKRPKQPPAPSVADEKDEDATEPTPTPSDSHSHIDTATATADDDTAAPPPPTPDQILATGTDAEAPKPHWPHPPQPADLDPHDPNFLQSLHEKYFPSLPADPSKLAWMAPIPTPNSAADYDSPYHPEQDSLPVSSLRFDFRGALLPPRVSRAVPVSKGLHHHGEAPEAAGYTVRELARLARSAVPGQRCVAYQTLGRVLYRLGRGEFGGVGPDDDMALGIWREVEEGAVLRSLYEEAAGEEGAGHRSARAFAVEAIWLLEKGGWKTKLRKAR